MSLANNHPELMKRTLTTQKVILYALSLEVLLIVIQAASVWIKYGTNPRFTDLFMQGTGFYIFQILGFFIFILLAQFVFKNSTESTLKNALLLFFTGAVVEVGFYLFIQADYQGAFLYSIMDRIVAISFGIIIAFASGYDLQENEVKA